MWNMWFGFQIVDLMCSILSFVYIMHMFWSLCLSRILPLKKKCFGVPTIDLTCLLYTDRLRKGLSMVCIQTFKTFHVQSLTYSGIYRDPFLIQVLGGSCISMKIPVI